MNSVVLSNKIDQTKLSGIGLLIIASLVAILSVFCSIFGIILLANDNTIITPGTQNITTPRQEITIAGQENPVIFAEIADNDETRARGLMFRESLGPDEGMLFIFNDSQIRNFWMKDTYISLDIIFIDADKQIINIAENTTPRITTRTYSSTAPAMYVLEVNAGRSQELGLTINTQLEF